MCVGESLRLGALAHYAYTEAKRFFGIPDFRYYALADGLRSSRGFYEALRRQKGATAPGNTAIPLRTLKIGEPPAPEHLDNSAKFL